MRNREGLFALLLLGIVFLAYVAGVHGVFQFDDFHAIVQNPALRQLSNIPVFWIDASLSSIITENQVLRPLSFTLLTLCWKLANGATWPFHLLKILFHFFFCFGCYAVWRRVLDPFTPKAKEFCMALAVFLAVHTGFTQTVNYISAAASQFCAVFYVWSFYFWITKDVKKLGWRRRSLSVLLFCLAFFCKEEAITLPALILGWEWLRSNRTKDLYSRLCGAVIAALPLLAVSAVLLLWFYAFFPGGYRPSSGSVSRENYFFTQWRAYLYYMKLWLWPWDLNADNLGFGFSTGFFDSQVLQALVGNLLIIAVTVKLSEKAPFLGYGLIWFYVTLLPASSVVPLDEAVNENRMYLALAGFSGMTGWLIYSALNQWTSKKYAKIGVWGFLFVALFVGTQLRNQVWQTKESFWADTLQKNPQSFRAMNNLALEYMAVKKYDLALQLLENCERVAPRYAYCLMNRGLVLSSLERLKEAEEAFLKAQSILPGNTYANYYVGQFYWNAKQPTKALPYLQKANAISGGKHLESRQILEQISH